MSYLDGARSRQGPPQFPPRSNAGASSSTDAASAERADQASSSDAAQDPAPQGGAQIAQPPPLVVGPIRVNFTLSNQPIDRVRRQIEDLGYRVENLTTSESSANGVQTTEVSCDISIEANSPPYLLMPEKLYAKICEAAEGTALQQTLLSGDLQKFTSDLFRASSALYRNVGPREIPPYLPPLDDPMDAYPRGQLDVAWCQVTRLAPSIRAALERDAQLPAEQRLSPERRSLLEATALEIELGYTFARPFFNAHHQLQPNPTLHQICIDHGFPAALRIAYHHRATAESPAWQFLFPGLNPLPHGYDHAFHEYSEIAREYAYAREDNPGLTALLENAQAQPESAPNHSVRNFIDAIAATPMRHAIDKVRQDRALCDRLIQLTQANMELAQTRLRSLGSPELTPEAAHRYNEARNALDEAETSVTSLRQLKRMLQIAEGSPSVLSFLETHDYMQFWTLPDDFQSALTRSQADSEVQGRWMVAINDLVQHGQNHERELASLHQQLARPDISDAERSQVHGEITALGARDFAANQMLSALDSLRRSPQLPDVLTAPDPERAMQLARTAWTVAHETAWGADAQLTFEAVLFWLGVADDDRIGHVMQAADTGNSATASMESMHERADRACRALEGYVGILEKRLADPELAQHGPEIQAQMEMFVELSNNIRNALAPQP